MDGREPTYGSYFSSAICASSRCTADLTIGDKPSTEGRTDGSMFDALV